ncbi:MAG: MSMEG_4193 family putative phosphomutase [Actinomycetota bacterium]
MRTASRRTNRSTTRGARAATASTTPGLAAADAARPGSTPTQRSRRQARAKQERTWRQEQRAAAARRPAAAKPTTILLVRHGQTPTTGKVLPGRAPGLHLADDGVRQAEITAGRIAEIGGVAAVYSSPLERAQETAAPISQPLGLTTIVDAGLFECDFGDWTGASLSSLMKLPEWQTVQRAPSTFRFPNGESFTEMQTRMVSTLDRLRRRHPGETIVCVSHADTIKAAVAHALGTHIDLFQRIVISPASVSALTWHSGGPIVLAVNQTGRSLSELRPS